MLPHPAPPENIRKLIEGACFKSCPIHYSLLHPECNIPDTNSPDDIIAYNWGKPVDGVTLTLHIFRYITSQSFSLTLE